MPEVKAIHFASPGPASSTLKLTTLPFPTPSPQDLLVRIKACAINPVDTKIRQGAFPAHAVTGFDAAGIVEQVGSDVRGFKESDEVYYSGVLGRQGSTATYSLVDHRVAALKPTTLDFAHAAAVPLVSVTARELLTEHFNLLENDPQSVQKGKSILIINGAGGVGSIATQLARRVFKLGKVIVTASRPATVEHAQKMGATHVVSHHEELKPQLEKLGVLEKGLEYIMICHSTNAYMDQCVELACPTGKIGSIVEIEEKLEGMHKPAAFMKALSFHWELMLSKGVHGYDLESQGEILSKVAKLFDEGVLSDLVGRNEVQTLSVRSLVEGHEKLEGGKVIGKIAYKVEDDIQ